MMMNCTGEGVKSPKFGVDFPTAVAFVELLFRNEATYLTCIVTIISLHHRSV